uniref:Protein mu n=1 Tax=Human adenovirus A serotype 31 TaxID=10529 RepID=Q67720_ADE31|nr:protein mu precursor [Human adenovirus 31]
MALTCRMRIPIPGYRGRSHRRRGLLTRERDFGRRSREVEGRGLPLIHLFGLPLCTIRASSSDAQSSSSRK